MTNGVVVNAILLDQIVDMAVVHLTVIDNIDARLQVDALVPLLVPLSLWGLLNSIGMPLLLFQWIREESCCSLLDHIEKLFPKLIIKLN